MENLDNLKNHKKSKRKYFECCELSEKDFYPPEDTRYYRSGVRDIKDGDNFAEYAAYFFDNYGKDIFDY